MGRWTLLTLLGLCASACGSNGGLPLGGTGGGGTGGATSGSGGTGNPLPMDSGTAAEAAQDLPSSVNMDAADTSPSGGTGGSGGAIAGDGGPSAPCPGGALLCDDFEKYATAADLTAAWKPVVSGATMVVDDTKGWKGGKSLHIKGPTGTPSAVIVKDGAPLFPIAGNVMYGRVMMFLTGTPGGGYHWNSIQAAGVIPTSNLWGKYGWGGQSGKVLAGYTVRQTAAGSVMMDCSKPSAMAFPDQKWVCVEWAFDGIKNQMHMWLDGTLLADADINGMGTRCVNSGDIGKPWAGPTFSNLTIGWQQYQVSSGPLELWLDELVVDKVRVGCPAP